VVADDTIAREFLIAIDETMRFIGDSLHMISNKRHYAERTVRYRLHQPVSRAQVMHACTTTCAVCSLKHGDLLDAAHIIADSDVDGFARVSHGLALCKIHLRSDLQSSIDDQADFAPPAVVELTLCCEEEPVAFSLLRAWPGHGPHRVSGLHQARSADRRQRADVTVSSFAVLLNVAVEA